MAHNLKYLSDFYAIGINYQKAEVAVRSQFALPPENCKSVYNRARATHLHELFIVSTCNRTEVYGFATNPQQLIELVCKETTGAASVFQERCYIKKGIAAIEHLFTVAAGLDSQLLGDYEITGQLKAAVKLAKSQGCMGVFTERLVNTALQSSKKIKNTTQLSGGTVSVSFAAITYIRQHVQPIKDKKILLVGAGKIGRSTCKNITRYLATKNITLVNRTVEKAAALATELAIAYAPISELTHYVQQSDIIIAATNAISPLILQSQVEGYGKKLIIDLSIPYNVETSIQNLPDIEVLTIDELLKQKDETLQKRMAAIPEAREIITAHINEFLEWYNLRHHIPALKAVQLTLHQIQVDPLFVSSPKYHRPGSTANEKIQQVITRMASKLKKKNQKGCHYIEAINEFITSRPHSSV